jgi:hypothetical protein
LFIAHPQELHIPGRIPTITRLLLSNSDGTQWNCAFGSKCFPFRAKKGSLSAAHNRLVYEDVDQPERATSNTKKVVFVPLSSRSSVCKVVGVDVLLAQSKSIFTHFSFTI